MAERDTNAEQEASETPLSDESFDDVAADVAAAADGTAENVAALESLQAELAQANERVLRAHAELENYRRRARREMDEQRQYAQLPLLTDLLPALDNLQRAIEAAEKSANATGLVEGVKMVVLQIQAVLEKYQCRQIAASGAAFDPHQHEALAQEPSDSVAAGCVTRVIRAGYRLHDRVVRPAQVMVSTGPVAPTTANDSNPGAPAP